MRIVQKITIVYTARIKLNLFTTIDRLQTEQLHWTDRRQIEHIKSGQTDQTNNVVNCIHNKILDCDWFSVQLFVTRLACDHVGVQLQVSNLIFL